MRTSPAIAAATLALAATLGALPLRADPPRDPFAPWQRPTVAAGAAPLQRFPLEELRLVGVVAGTASPRALIAAPDGASHIARVGDWIGTSWGKIAAIRPGAVVVVARYRDPLGGVHEERAELRLESPAKAAIQHSAARGAPADAE